MKITWKKIKEKSSRMSLVEKRIGFATILVLVIIILYGVADGSKTALNSKDANAIVLQVAKLMVLPAGETPTIFEIADPAFVATKEPFFIGAEKGDILLIYQKAGKAVIYSKSRNIIVNAGPLVGNK